MKFFQQPCCASSSRDSNVKATIAYEFILINFVQIFMLINFNFIKNGLKKYFNY